MKKLIVVRHGHAPPGVDFDWPISADGVEQIEWLAKTLLAHVLGSVGILSSTAKRGRTTTGILSRAFNASVVFDKKLWDDNGHEGGSLEDIAALVRQQKPELETLIIVGHKDHGDRLAGYLAKAVYERPIRVPFSDGLVYGGACII